MNWPSVLLKTQPLPHTTRTAHGKKRSRAILYSVLMALGLLAAIILPCCSPPYAIATPATITGSCYIECTNHQLDGAAGGNIFIVRFPQYSIETTGYCTSGPMYGTPLPGYYPFTGTLVSDGTYAIDINTAGAGMYANHYSDLGAQQVGGFSISITGSFELRKEGDPAFEAIVAKASVQGAVYELRKSDGSVAAKLVTNSEGKAYANNLMPGTYQLVETKPSPGYTLDKTVQNAVISANALCVLTSTEIPCSGAIRIQKASAKPSITNNNTHYQLEGAVFGVYTEKECRNQVTTITTNKEGVATTKNNLWPRTYWIKELTPPPGFALSSKVVSLALSVDDCNEEKIPHATIENEPQLVPARVVIEKIDSETNSSKPQGEASLAGAVFQVEHYRESISSAQDIRKNGLKPTNSQTIVTDKNGSASINSIDLPSNSKGKGYPLGTLVITEIVAPPGYLLPNNPVTVVKLSGKGNSIFAPSPLPTTISEQIIRGDLSLKKIGSAEGSIGDDVPKVPLEGIAFDIIRATDNTTVSRLITDEQGNASTQSLDDTGEGHLAYGTYLVREDPATTPPGYDPVPEFMVTISQHKKVLSYRLDDKTGTYLRIEKHDSETGEIIRGITEFQILDGAGNLVSFPSNRENDEPQTTFTTNEDGVGILPDKLNGGGTYYLKEITAPLGYVVEPSLIPFSLGKSEGRNPEEPFVITLNNRPQTSRLIVKKTNLESNEEIHSEGITWKVEAQSDIVTADGTIRAQAGETVAELISNADGIAQAEGLYPGTYRIIETQAPPGYARQQEPVTVEIVQGDQTLLETKTHLNFPNQPIKGRVLLHKTDKQTGENVEGATYQLRAAETIVAPDGKTLLYERGVVLDTLRTDEAGNAQSVEVPCGEYELVELKAPEGYELDTQIYPVSLKEKDQDTPLVEAKVEVSDLKETEETPHQSAPHLAKTGDTLPLLLAGATAAISFLTLVIAQQKRESLRHVLPRIKK